MFAYNMNKVKKTIVSLALCVVSIIASANASDDFFTAARNDDESTMVKLLLRGFDLNARDAVGNHALSVAIREGSMKVADFLLKQPSLQVEARNVQGESPLMIAALNGQLALARRLIERKAEVNKTGWTPLHYAATSATPVSASMVRLLLEHHAYIDAESPNRTTPLMMAAQYGMSEVVRLLLEEGADPTLRNEQGLTAIDFARQASRPDAVALIAASVRARSPSGTW
jgi:ankyrin repeat protein